MKKLYVLLFLTVLLSPVLAQTIVVAGKCINGPILLNKEIALEAGKVAYTGSGTVLNFPNIAISIFWIGAPDNVWVLAFDGQPYFKNTCNTALPPSSFTTGCTWTEVTPGDCPGATALSVLGLGTLPVTLTSFTAQSVNQTVRLKWTTTAEVNSKGFTIQQSSNGTGWMDIGFVKGAGTSAVSQQYQFIDVAPVNGINNYRLSQTDFDGRITYSQIESVNITVFKSYTLQRFANGQYQLMVSTPLMLQISIVDLKGRRLMSNKISQGRQILDLSNYPAGMYLLQIIDGRTTRTEKLVKP